MKHPLLGMTLLIAGAASIPAQAATPFLGPAEVTTFGTIYRYEGPLGAGIYNEGSGPVAGREQTWFRDRARGILGGAGVGELPFGPQNPYAGYEDSAFAAAGTGTVALLRNGPQPGGQSAFWTGTRGVDFFLQQDGIPPAAADVNSLVIEGTVTQNVSIDPATGKSGVIKLATISFTNGAWFDVSPPVDPGLGSLYPESVFSFRLIAAPDPFIGTSIFNGFHEFDGNLVLVSTIGSNTPDYLVLSQLDGIAPNVLAMDEGITGTVELWGRIGSLEPMELRNPSTGVQILSAIPTTPIPEPSTYLQMLLGFGALVAARKAMRRS